MYKSEGVIVSTDNVLMIYQIVHGLNTQAQDTRHILYWDHHVAAFISVNFRKL